MSKTEETTENVAESKPVILLLSNYFISCNVEKSLGSSVKSICHYPTYLNFIDSVLVLYFP